MDNVEALDVRISISKFASYFREHEDYGFINNGIKGEIIGIESLHLIMRYLFMDTHLLIKLRAVNCIVSGVSSFSVNNKVILKELQS